MNYLYNYGDGVDNFYVVGGGVNIGNPANISFSAANGNNSTLATKQKINLTNVKTLYAYVSATLTSPAYFYMGITSVEPQNNSSYDLKSGNAGTTSGSFLSLNVSNITGEYYIKIGLQTGSGGDGTAFVYSIFLD